MRINLCCLSLSLSLNSSSSTSSCFSALHPLSPYRLPPIALLPSPPPRKAAIFMMAYFTGPVKPKSLVRFGETYENIWNWLLMVFQRKDLSGPPGCLLRESEALNSHHPSFPPSFSDSVSSVHLIPQTQCTQASLESPVEVKALIRKL